MSAAMKKARLPETTRNQQQRENPHLWTNKPDAANTARKP
jgi:hypothetical protein